MKMWAWIHKISSPKTAYRLAKRCQPWLMLMTLLAMGYGLIAGLLFAPADYQQGDVFRIMYLHVPAAIGSLAVYLVMYSTNSLNNE